MEEFKNYSASLDDRMPYCKLILLAVNSCSRDTENYKNLSLECSLILSFDVLKQILARLNGEKIYSDILVHGNSDI